MKLLNNLQLGFWSLLGCLALTFLAPSVQAKASANRMTANCSWDRPGQNPFMGDIPNALDRYPDLAPDVRERLRARMTKRDYDDIVTIRRDAIVGRGDQHQYEPAIRDMHFGQDSVCASVSRTGWTDDMQERGLVYCDEAECILVPTVCRNVSRITRRPQNVVGLSPEEPFAFAPPGAGVAPPTDASTDSLSGAPPTDALEGPLGATPFNATPLAGIPGVGTEGDDTPIDIAPGAGAPNTFAPSTPYATVPGGGLLPAALGPTLIPAITAPVPELQTWLSMGTGLLGMALLSGLRRHRRSLSTRSQLHHKQQGKTESQ